MSVPSLTERNLAANVVFLPIAWAPPAHLYEHCCGPHRYTRPRLERRNHVTVDAGLLDHSAAMARRLDEEAPASVHRIDTDELGPVEIAARMFALTEWGS